MTGAAVPLSSWWSIAGVGISRVVLAACVWGEALAVDVVCVCAWKVFSSRLVFWGGSLDPCSGLLRKLATIYEAWRRRRLP